MLTFLLFLVTSDFTCHEKLLGVGFFIPLFSNSKSKFSTSRAYLLLIVNRIPMLSTVTHVSIVWVLCFNIFALIVCAQSADDRTRYITSTDITSHPTYEKSLSNFLKIESEMYRIKERASFHSFVHIIPTVLELIHAVNVLEIGKALVLLHQTKTSLYHSLHTNETLNVMLTFRICYHIGSYCGASLILELTVPSVQHLVSVDLKAHPTRDTPGTIAKNVQKYNIHGATFNQVTGDSRDKEIVSRTHEIFTSASKTVDFFFIDGDHRDCAPDFYLYHSLVRPGGVIMFDDYYDKRIQRSIKSILSKPSIRNCYHVLGTPLNLANASTLKSTNPPPLLSNEFIMQKKMDCVSAS